MTLDLLTRSVTLRLPFSARTFSVTGSANDKSVVGATADANGIWEPEIMRVMSEEIGPGHLCLDIGANVGIHTLAMAEIARHGEVHAFEPSTTTFDYLRKNVEANGLANVRLHHLGLSNEVGPRQFHNFHEYAGCSVSGEQSLDADVAGVMGRAWGVVWEYATESVHFTTLDRWAAEQGLTRLDFIKMDVEGFERFVLEGGVETLRRFRPKLITEFNVKALHAYYGVDPRSYFDLLRSLFATLSVIKPDGSTMEVHDFSDLEAQLSAARFWADLLCRPS